MSEPHGASHAARLVVPALSDGKPSPAHADQQHSPAHSDQESPAKPRRSTRRRSERRQTPDEIPTQEVAGWRERCIAAWTQSSARQKAAWAACAVAALLLVGWVALRPGGTERVREDDELSSLTAALKHPAAENAPAAKAKVVQTSGSLAPAGEIEAQQAIHFAPADRGPESEQIERVEFVPVQRAARGAVWLSGTIEDAIESRDRIR
jgi:hypothetical protein